MSNLNKREGYSRETHREVYRDANGNAYAQQTTTTPGSDGQRAPHDPTAYKDGYVQGRVSEQRLNEENQRVRDNDNAASGLVIGILLTSLAGIVIGLLFFLNQRNETPTPASAPPVTAPSSAPASQPSNNRTTIIERTKTEVIPVPQQPVAVPDVNITVPDSSQQAPAQTAPNQTAPTQPTDPSSAPSGGSSVQNNGTTPVAPQGSTTQDQTGTTSSGSGN